MSNKGDNMTKQELNRVIKKSIEMQNKLFKRLESETGKQSREWTAMQISYQKSIYKTAMLELNNYAASIVDGVKVVDITELNEYYSAVC